jgi:hypothetical protein
MKMIFLLLESPRKKLERNHAKAIKVEKWPSGINGSDSISKILETTRCG